MLRRFHMATLVALAAILLSASTPTALATLVGPTPYLSAADIPAGFYAGSPTIENFEDGTLSFGITATAGSGPFGPSTFADSVDGDDGFIDGSGSNGISWLLLGDKLTFEFSNAAPYPTAAGLVWTDWINPDATGGVGSFTFEAFGPTNSSLGTIGPATLGDGLFTGQTAEDRFFGVQDAGGIRRIEIRATSVAFLEVDHVQFGVAAIPEAGAWMMLGVVLLGVVAIRQARLAHSNRFVERQVP